jgi:hypothetical protein
VSLPAGVSLARAGSRQFVTQRGYFTPPFCSCMFAALCSVLTWMGYELPLARKKANTPPENFVTALHKASTAPLNQATTIGQSRRALRALLPDVDVKSGRLTDEEFIEELKKDAAIRVTASMKNLPEHLQRWAGSRDVGHAFCVIGTRICNGEAGRHAGHAGVREVFWMDPMGRPSKGYDGEWVPWRDVRPHLRRKRGAIAVTLGYKDAAIRKKAGPVTDDMSVIAVESAVSLHADAAVTEIFDLLGFKGRVAERTPVLNPRTGETVTRIAPTDQARCLGRTKDGRHVGILVNTAKLPGPNPKVLLIEASSVERGS